jgi:AraC-like DNA-binding protein
MAKKLKTNRSYLSQIIKMHKKKKFNAYINDLRITYTINRLQTDTKFCKFSVASIAKEVGYKSDYSFVKHFKERTKVKPSDYIKKILEAKA